MNTYAVVITTHRRPALLRQALESVAAQTRVFDEVVVVVDGAEPETAELARSFGARVLQQPGSGVAAARNTGIAAATAEWICFLDDDNLYHPAFLTSVDRYLGQHPEVRALNTGFWTFIAAADGIQDLVAADYPGALAAAADTAVSSDLSYLRITGHSYDLLLEGLRGAISSCCVRADLLLQAGGFPVGQICAEDWTMFLNVARYTEWHVLDDRLAFFRVHPGNNSSVRALQNGVATLRAFGDAWSDRTRPVPPHRPLGDYRYPYRFMVHSALETARRARNVRVWLQLYRLSRRLLTRRTDRLQAALPDPWLQSLRRVSGRSSQPTPVRPGDR